MEENFSSPLLQNENCCIFTLRNDFLGQIQKQPQLNQASAKENFNPIVPAMSKDELERASARPAELAERFGAIAQALEPFEYFFSVLSSALRSATFSGSTTKVK